MTMDRTELKALKEKTLRDLRRGLNFLSEIGEEEAPLVIGLHVTALGVLRRNKYLTAEEMIEEIRKLYVAVEAAHPGKWEALGGPRLPDTLTA
jgi:hypothetical protein